MTTHLDQLRSDLRNCASVKEVIQVQQHRCPGGVYPSRRNRAAARAVREAIASFEAKPQHREYDYAS